MQCRETGYCIFCLQKKKKDLPALTKPAHWTGYTGENEEWSRKGENNHEEQNRRL